MPASDKQSKQDESRQIAKEAISLSASNYLCRVLYLFRGLGVAALLQPEIYGIWSVLKALQDSTAFSNLGASFALLREVVLAKREGDQNRIEGLQSTALNLSLLVTAAIALILLLASFTPLMPVIAPELRISLLVMLLSCITYYIPRQLQAHTDFFFQARYLLVYAFLNTVFSLLAVYFWGLTEMLWGLVLAHLLVIVYVMRHGKLAFSARFDRASARTMVSSGLPVMLGGSLFFFLRAADQFLVYALIGSVASGYYAISNFVAMTITQIPVALAATLFPRMMERHSDGASRQEIEHLFFQPVKFLCLGTPILLGASYFAIEPVLAYLLPNYLPALDIIRVALLAIFFQSIWSLAHSLLLAFEKQKQEMLLSLALLAVNIAAVTITISMGGELMDVVWVANIVSFLSALIILGYIFSLLERGLMANLMTVAEILLPLLYGVAVCLLIDTGFEFGGDTLPLLMDAFLKLLLFAVAAAPYYFFLWRMWLARNSSAATHR